MAKAVAFGTLLEQRCGLDTPESRQFIVDQGYQTISSFASVPYDGVESFVIHLNKAATNDNQKIKHGSILKLKALRAWIEFS